MAHKRVWQRKAKRWCGLFLVALVLFVGLTGTGCSATPGHSPAHTARSIPVPLADTTENIHPGMVHDSQQALSEEQGNIDYVWGSDYPGEPRGLHKSFYFNFDRAGGYSGDTAFPVYYDVNWFHTYHPDWLVYLCDRTTLAYEFGDPNVPLDITNPAVLEFMLNTWIYPALDRGYDGIAFDNVNLTNTASAGRCGVWKTNSQGKKEWVYLYGDASGIEGPRYVASIVNWARFMYYTIHAHTPGATMEVNFSPDNGGVTSEPLSFNEQLIPYIDFAFNEDGYTYSASNNTAYGSSGFTTDANWRQEIDFSLDLAAHGKGQLLTFGFAFSDLTQQQKQWALANYLLVKGAHTYIYIAQPDVNGANYGYMNILPEYSAKIGHAINVMYRSQGVYMRDYSNGKTLVNPSSSLAVAVTLPPHRYKDLYGNVIDAPFTLNPYSGIVLLALSSPTSL